MSNPQKPALTRIAMAGEAVYAYGISVSDLYAKVSFDHPFELERYLGGVPIGKCWIVPRNISCFYPDANSPASHE